MIGVLTAGAPHRHERLTALDAAFVNQEKPHAPMHIGWLCTFSRRVAAPGRPGLPGISDIIAERLPLLPRYRQRLRSVPLALGHPVWVDDPEFSVRNHVHHVTLPKPASMREVVDFASREHARPLDRNRPLWEMWIIDGLRDGRLALYGKTHHALMDGISAVDLATILLDFDAEGAEPIPAPPFSPAPIPSGPELVRDLMAETVTTAANRTTSALRDIWALPRQLIQTATSSAEAMAELVTVLKPAPRSPLNATVGPRRRIELVNVPLARAKAIKDHFGSSVNDVVLAVVGEAVHIFLESRGERSDGVWYRVMVPVNVRDESDRAAMGNKISAMFVDLPVGPMPAARRLETVMRVMSDRKQRRQAAASDQFLSMASLVPPAFHSLSGRLDYSGQRLINLIVSNVPTVQVPLYAGGARMLEAYPLLPLGANLASVICVATYNNAMHFGLVGDFHVLPDLDVLARGISQGFARLRRATGGSGHL